VPDPTSPGLTPIEPGLFPDPTATAIAGSNPWGVFGQDGAVEALRRALRSDNLAHAYLISGPDGVGKRTLAYRLAQTLVSPSADDPTLPDLATRAARQIEADDLPDIERIALGGICDESNHDHTKDNSTRIRICQVRRMERVASLAPYASPRRIFIIDTADQLQVDAAHALLKTLEEPPPSVLILLLATDPDALLPTIRSRCQELPLHPSSHAALAEVLAIDPGVADPTHVARLARGRYGLAQRMLKDPAFAVMQESVVAEAQRLARASRNERFDYAERLGGAWRQERELVLQTLDLWREWWRDILVASSGAEVDVPADAAAEAVACRPADALRALHAVQRARDHLLANTNPQLALEVMMLDLPVLSGPAPTGREEREPAAAR